MSRILGGPAATGSELGVNRPLMKTGCGRCRLRLLEGLNNVAGNAPALGHGPAVVPSPITDGFGLLTVNRRAGGRSADQRAPLGPATDPAGRTHIVGKCVSQLAGVLLGE